MIVEAILATTLAALGAGLAIADRLLSVRRRMQRVPRATIADAPENKLTRVHGRATAVEDGLKAPLSGRPCVAWSIQVSRFRQTAQDAHWERLLNADGVEVFRVVEGNSTALVVGPRIRLDIELDHDVSTTSLNDTILRLAADRGEVLATSAHYRVREGIVATGKQVTVVGRGRWQVDPRRAGGSYREAGRHYVIDAPEGETVYVSDASFS